MGGPRGEEGSALDPCHLNNSASAHVESLSCLETSLLNGVDNSRRVEPGRANPKSRMDRTPVGAQLPSPQLAPPKRHGPLTEQEPGVSGLARAPGQSWLVLRTSSHEDTEEGRFTSHVLLVHFANIPPQERNVCF